MKDSFNIIKMTDLDLANKRVLIREDFNVPIENRVISNDRRIAAAIPTIQLALKQNAKVILISHLGRPEEGNFQNEFSLAPVAVKLTKLLKQPVTLIKDWLNGFDIKPGQVVLCENVRFNKGEKNNDATLAKKIAFDSKIKNIKIVSAMDLIAYVDENQKAYKLIEIVTGAYPAENSFILLDDTEILVNFVELYSKNMVFSNKIYQVMATLLKTPPPEQHNITFICTCTNKTFLECVEKLFDYVFCLGDSLSP